METVVISGGSSGIGEACVNKFLASSYLVFNLDLVENSRLNLNPGYHWFACDVSDEAQIQLVISQVKAIAPTIKVLIAAAGKHLAASIETTSSQQLSELLNLNLLGAYWLIKYTLPAMKALGGSIILLGSDQSKIAKPNSAVYGMTKAALAHLAKSTALDYASYNIRANCIAAGTIDTPLYRRAIRDYAERSGILLSEIEDEEARQQPLGRIGSADEVAELAYFLAQDTQSYLTGALIPLDGGYTAR